MGLLLAWEAGRVGAGGVSPTATLVCSLAAEHGDKDKVGATWKPPSVGPGTSEISPEGQGDRAGTWSLGTVPLSSGVVPPLDLHAWPHVLFMLSVWGWSSWGPGGHKVKQETGRGPFRCPTPEWEGPGAPLGTKGPCIRREGGGGDGRGWSCLGDEMGMKEMQPAGRCFFSYGLGFSICDMGPHQVGVVKGLGPFKAQESALGGRRERESQGREPISSLRTGERREKGKDMK